MLCTAMLKLLLIVSGRNPKKLKAGTSMIIIMHLVNPLHSTWMAVHCLIHKKIKLLLCGGKTAGRTALPETGTEHILLFSPTKAGIILLLPIVCLQDSMAAACETVPTIPDPVLC